MKANRKFVEGEEAVSAVIGVILMVAITVAIAATVYVYVSGMLTGPGESAPNLAWTTNDADNTITITSGSASDDYASATGGAGAGNLVFKSPGGTEWWVESTFNLKSFVETTLRTAAIGAGDVIKGFDIAGDWQIIWEPTDKLLGTITFS
ncbi:MAG: type IV pilin N-terminal domain-containing protein [Thermoplasmatales archaeon]|nr:type IV pilin N-terminal domain-containing protein [Thermoplasmatales archaeon]